MGSRVHGVGTGRPGKATLLVGAITVITAITVIGLIAALVVHRAGTGPSSAPGAQSASLVGATPSAGGSGAGNATPSAAGSPSPAVVIPSWYSGASSDEASDGSYGRWRATPIQIGGTWDNGNSEQLLMRTICPGGSWETWDKPLDDAVGAIDVDAGETWARAARGAYLDRWRAHLEKTKECWGQRDPGLLYLRFAHELNLPQKWRVRGGEEGDFVKAITLYSNLRYEIIPGAKIVLCTNDGTDAGLNGLDIRKLWPGRDAQSRQVVDVYGTDSYNQSPHVTTVADFAEKILGTYPNGIPLGLERHRRLAQSWGVPFAVPEWSNNGRAGDRYGGGESTVYIQQFYAWARAHAGDPSAPSPGQLLYDVQFNLWDQFAFWPKTIQPKTAAAYRALPWGR